MRMTEDIEFYDSYRERRKRSLTPEYSDKDGWSPDAKRVRTLQSVVVVSDWRKECRPEACLQARERHKTAYNKRCRRESTESREGSTESGAGFTTRSSSDSNDHGYCSLHGTSRYDRGDSARSRWRSGAGKTRRGLCRCKRHSESAVKIKSTQNRRGERDRHRRRDSERGRERKRHRRADRYRSSRDCRSKLLIKEDREGQLSYREQDILHDRYELGRTLGSGTFGQVVECRDLKRDGRKVAMKIVRKGGQDYDSAIMEVRVLESLQLADTHKNSGCIEMLDWFDYEGHICIVFEMMGHSVYEFLRRNAYRPFPLDQVQTISKQLCQAVLFCHEHGLTHTDLKPENVLFCDSSFDFVLQSPVTQWRDTERRVRRADVKLIDFGSALFDYEPKGSVIATRQYRPPEVILDLGWSHSADVWSVGCIMFELFTGKTLFQTHDSLEHLAMIERVLGRIPSHMVDKCPRKKRYFRDGRLSWDVKSRSGRTVDKKCRPLKTYASRRDSAREELIDLIHQMLELDPARRIDLRTALRHPFFSHKIYQS